MPDASVHHRSSGSVPAERLAVAYLPEATTPPHEREVHANLARRLAMLMGYDDAGEQQPAAPGRALAGTAARRYWIPAATLDQPAQVRALGIRRETDFFGGVVPAPFVASKIITHDLVDEQAEAVRGWSAAFARRVAPVVLNGFSVFTHEDALRAGRLLLQDGPVRLKPAHARGGRGQRTVEDMRALNVALDAIDAQDLRDGLVVEEELEDIVTFSVGQLRLPGLTASYSGTQRLTTDNRGELVYGGSDLDVVVGGFDALLAQTLPADVHRAVESARRYDQAASDCFEGLLASRRNYDVVIGRNGRGRRKCGVLEQSWRIGGASGAEVAAVSAAQPQPQLDRE
ncbi:MAG: hypothetical protein GAK30_00722 [Paracidovorax wautersii]|uniref:ATP-grasp domain-containing protein n=1 Tax=Paracidovorax wautersii TaxID=1177982 RepID=A0A7V8FR56_9BURK|nr:MAG: hypothetical protein GAK30_00722 [Paracidovorax wautersii]